MIDFPTGKAGGSVELIIKCIAVNNGQQASRPALIDSANLKGRNLSLLFYCQLLPYAASGDGSAA